MNYPRTASILLAFVLSAPITRAQIAAPPPTVRPDVHHAPALPSDAAPPIKLFSNNPTLKPAANIPVEYTHANSISLDTRALAALYPGRTLSLSPEPGIADLWQVASVSRPSAHIGIVRCTHITDPSAYLAFCTYNDATAMTMQVPLRHATYRLQAAGQRSYFIWKLDPAKTAREADAHDPPFPDIVPPAPDPNDDDWQPPSSPYSPRVTSGCAGANPVIDIMMVYTATARDLIGGDNAMRAECTLAVDHVNTAYRNSDMTTQMRLVYCDLIDYQETGDHFTDLPRLRNPSDGYLDSVHQLRDALNADLVSLVSNAGTGIAYCPSAAPAYASHAFSTCRWTRVAATFTLAHETGHNLGAGHDVDSGGPCGPDWAIGFVFGPPESRWGTVMAYADVGITRVLHYSNPNITFQGYATGSPVGAPDEAHNQRIMIENDNTIEAFELTRYDIYVNFGFTGVGVGSPSNPYNSIASALPAVAVPTTGATDTPRLYMATGSNSFTGTISKSMQLLPCDGPVTLGITP